MKYKVRWLEYHEAEVEADSPEEAEVIALESSDGQKGGIVSCEEVNAMKYIGIIGTRRREEVADFRKVLKKFDDIRGDNDIIVSGGCPQGGDRFAEEIAKGTGLGILIFYPVWHKHGKSAGYQRNKHIAAWADVLIACVAKDRTGGTEDTIRKFQKAHPEGTVHIV